MGELGSLFRWKVMLLKEISERVFSGVGCGDIRKHLFSEGIAFDALGGVAAVADDSLCLPGAEALIRDVFLKARVTVFNQPVFSPSHAGTSGTEIFGELAQADLFPAFSVKYGDCRGQGRRRDANH